jgi:hypothetical protein
MIPALFLEAQIRIYIIEESRRSGSALKSKFISSRGSKWSRGGPWTLIVIG